MTKEQGESLMQQIAAMYVAWAWVDYSPSSEEVALLQHGLFNIAKEIDLDRMNAAFAKGVRRGTGEDCG